MQHCALYKFHMTTWQDTQSSSTKVMKDVFYKFKPTCSTRVTAVLCAISWYIGPGSTRPDSPIEHAYMPVLFSFGYIISPPCIHATYSPIFLRSVSQALGQRYNCPDEATQNDMGKINHIMMSSNGNTFRITGPLCGEFTGHRWIPLTKASDMEHWCFLLVLIDCLGVKYWKAKLYLVPGQCLKCK